MIIRRNFNLDLYSKKALERTLEVYRTVKEVSIDSVEEEYSMKIEFKSEEKDDDIEILVNEFSNYALGVTKEMRKGDF